MKKTVYFVVNEGEVVYASLSQEKAEAYALEQSQSDLEETVEESGRDIEDLTIEELDELRFQSGFDGGYYYTGSVEYDESNEDETFETEEGDVIYFDDLEECLDRDEDDDFLDDGECFEGDDDDFEGDDDDFEEYEEDIFDAEWNEDDEE